MTAVPQRRPAGAATARWLAATLLAALTLPGLAADYVAPRVPGSEHPDLNGIWQALNTAHYDVEPHMARHSMQLRDGPHGPLPAVELLRLGAVGAVPAGSGVTLGPIPYTPEALAKKRDNQANWLERDPEIKCYLPGVPRATYMPYPFQIVQNGHAMMFVYEFGNAVREVYLKDIGPAPVDSWMGQSVGRWDGDTLVVEVTGLSDQTWFDRAGNHHSDQLKVTERYTPVSPYHLQYEALIEDPATFTEPWTISMPLYRRMEPDARLLDFRCIEFVEELMFGEWRRQPLARP
jgi:hypothetical protein